MPPLSTGPVSARQRLGKAGYSDVGKERFPHLYGAPNLDAVVEVVPFPEGETGFALPAEVWRRPPAHA